MNMKRHMLNCLFIFMLLSMEKKNEITIFKIMKYLLLDINFLPSYLSYLYQVISIWDICVTYKCFWDYENMLGKFISISLVKLSVKYFNACDESSQLRGGDICMRWWCCVSVFACIFKVSNICRVVYHLFNNRFENLCDFKVGSRICWKLVFIISLFFHWSTIKF
jgi:hypothetical protein